MQGAKCQRRKEKRKKTKKLREEKILCALDLGVMHRTRVVRCSRGFRIIQGEGSQCGVANGRVRFPCSLASVHV